MTVIAYDGKILAADKQATYGSTMFPVKKIFRLGDELLAGAGDWSECNTFAKWYVDGCPLDKKPDFKNGVSMLLIKNGEIWKYEDELVPFKIDMPFWALGSGADFAMGAMAAGKNAVEAVEIACKFDKDSGLGVDFADVEKPA